jgi:short-subunit dehydrogenase
MASNLVVVSGASSGIGEATAKRYGASGAHVLLLARSAKRLDRVAKAIRGAGGAADSCQVDLADPAAIEQTAARIERDFGTPDILVNNAGVGRWLPLIETTAKEALHAIEVPYLAAFNLTRAFLPRMLERGSGALAYVTSPASYLAWPNAAAYTASRRAVAGLAETLQSELTGRGISVTLVVLGNVLGTNYWANNPGSLAHVPKPDPILAPHLRPEQAAEAIFRGVEGRKRMVVKPASLRALFLLNALFPRLVARELRRAVPKSS